MLDLYIRTTSRDAMLSALVVLGVVVDGDFVLTSHHHCLDVLGAIVMTPGTYDDDGAEITPPVFHDGFFVALRCLTDDFAERALNAGLEIVDKPEGARCWTE